MKRLIDMVMASTGLVLAAPVMALIALAVKLDSPGRVIFSQERLGQEGRVFRVHKFRKFPDAWGDSGPGVTVAGDARMTRLGQFLERSKLDELPQLWNILRGDMSFVGPRPESLRYKDLFQEEFARVLDFRPGIFGPNQVAFRNESQMYPPDRDPEEFYREELFPRKARADIDYFSRANVVSDLAWICRGLWYSLTGAVDWGRLAAIHGWVVALDVLAVELAWLGANTIRFLGLPPLKHMDAYLTGMWLLPLVIVPMLVMAGCYRQPVRHFSAGGALRLGVVTVVGWIVGELLLLGLFHRSSSVMLGPLGLLLSLPFMSLPRIWYREHWRRQVRVNANGSSVSLAIYGAGRRGGALVTLLEQGFPNVEVRGLLDDDDVQMRGRVIMGRPILGSERDLDTIQAVYGIDQLWTTFEPDVHKHRRLRHWCANNGVKLVVLPVAEPFLPLRGPRTQEPKSETSGSHNESALDESGTNIAGASSAAR